MLVDVHERLNTAPIGFTASVSCLLSSFSWTALCFSGCKNSFKCSTVASIPYLHKHNNLYTNIPYLHKHSFELRFYFSTFFTSLSFTSSSLIFPLPHLFLQWIWIKSKPDDHPRKNIRLWFPCWNERLPACCYLMCLPPDGCFRYGINIGWVLMNGFCSGVYRCVCGWGLACASCGYFLRWGRRIQGLLSSCNSVNTMPRTFGTTCISVQRLGHPFPTIFTQNVVYHM